MIRFFLYVSMAFVTAFVGVSWAARGFPIHFSYPVPIATLQPNVSSTFGDDSTQKKHQSEVQDQLQSPENATRNALRLDALQAANAYALSPCGPGFKAELVKTPTAYAKGYMDIRGCTFMGCSDKKVDAAGAAFDSPLDHRVQDALKDAFDQDGITVEEFPSSLRIGVLNMAKNQGSSASRCTINAQGG